MENNLLNIVGFICEKRGITLQQLAERLNVSYQSLYSNLKPTGNPTLNRLKDIAKILNVPLSSLFQETKNTQGLKCPVCNSNLSLSYKLKRAED